MAIMETPSLWRRGLPGRQLVLCLLLASAVGCGRDGRPDVALIVLDTVRQDFTGVGGEATSRTPALDGLGAQGTVFSRVWATGPWTVPSHASIFTGELPPMHGCTALHPRLDTPAPTLAERLAEAGYESAAFFSNPWLSDGASGLLRGFEERHAAAVPGPVGADGADKGGGEILAAVEAWLGQRKKRPAFLFVNLLEAHAPYDPPPSIRQQQLPDLAADASVSAEWMLDYQAGLVPLETVDWARLRRLYGGGVRHADTFLAALLDLLGRHGWLAEGVVIVTSDHGESLGEAGFVEHQFRLDERLTAVPLVIHAPGRMPQEKRDEPVLLTDLFATVLELADIEDGELPPHSRSLLPAPDRRIPGNRPLVATYAGGPPPLLQHLAARNPALDPTPLARRYHAIRIGEMRLTLDDTGGEALHDLAADPEQHQNIAATHPELVRRLRSTLTTIVGDFSSSRQPEDTPQLDEETRQRLRALGYIQ